MSPKSRCFSIPLNARSARNNLPDDLRAEIQLPPPLDQYFLLWKGRPGKIGAKVGDPNREKFSYCYDIRRVCRGKNSRRRFDRRKVTPQAKEDRYGRWQLEVNLQARKPGGGFKAVKYPYHRLVGLMCWPCFIDHKGRTVDPFCVKLGGLTQGLYDRFWEVHHDNWNPRDNHPHNLWVLWWEVHQKLRRPT